MTSEDDDECSAEQTCAFCGSDGDCFHLLLVVDRTFRTAEGAILMDAFNARWSAYFEVEDFDEREASDEPFDEVDSLSDAMTDHDREGGHRMSSAYSTYFVKSEARAKRALNTFAKEIT